MKRISVSLMCALLTALVIAGTFGAQVAAQEATPAAGMSADETLTSIIVEREQLPAAEGVTVIGRETLPPGARTTCTCPDEQGTVINAVVSGSLTFELEEGGHIIRGTNGPTPVEEVAPAAIPFTLSAGDAVVFAGKKRVIANESAEPGTYVFALLLVPVAPPEPDPTDIGEKTTEVFAVVLSDWSALVSDSVTVIFSRTSLEAGEVLPAPTGGLQVVTASIVQDPATPTALVLGSDGSTTNSGVGEIEVLVVSLVPGSEATPTT